MLVLGPFRSAVVAMAGQDWGSHTTYVVSKSIPHCIAGILYNDVCAAYDVYVFYLTSSYTPTCYWFSLGGPKPDRILNPPRPRLPDTDIRLPMEDACWNTSTGLTPRPLFGARSSCGILSPQKPAQHGV